MLLRCGNSYRTGACLKSGPCLVPGGQCCRAVCCHPGRHTRPTGFALALPAILAGQWLTVTAPASLCTSRDFSWTATSCVGRQCYRCMGEEFVAESRHAEHQDAQPTVAVIYMERQFKTPQCHTIGHPKLTWWPHGRAGHQCGPCESARGRHRADRLPSVDTSRYQRSASIEEC